MSRKKALILVGIVTLIIIGGLAITSFLRPGTNDSGTPSQGGSDPFGSSGPDTRPLGRPDNPDTISFNPERASRIWRVTTEPVVASTFRFEKRGNDEFTYVRYLRRDDGHIFESEVKTRKPIQLSNTTVPRIQEAFWFDDIDKIVVRYLNQASGNIQTFVGDIVTQSGVEELEIKDGDQENKYKLDGAFLEENILELALKPNSSDLFYLTNQDGRTSGVVRSADGTRNTVFTSPLRELRPQWVNNALITLTTKASEDTPGFMFTLNPNTETDQLLLSDITSLTTLTNPDGEHILHYSNNATVPLLLVYSPATNNTARTSLITLPEKCVWSKLDTAIVYCAVPNIPPRSKYPDGWYQGLSSTNDLIWQINVIQNSSQIIATPPEFIELGAPEGIDGIGLTLSEDEKFLSFINKQDNSLWGVRLVEEEIGR